MSDQMRAVPFQDMLRTLLSEYRETGTLSGVTVDRSHADIPIGPAAGPHTQLAGNLVAAYAAGASVFELKTVQVLEGQELALRKPGIYTNHAVFNTEWSSELTVTGSLNEFIKAYLLICILSRELKPEAHEAIRFIMSVGYDLAGIQSAKVDYFLEHMKHAAGTAEWQRDVQFLTDHLDWFENVGRRDLEELSDCISNTATLSTMHGCKSSEIEEIAAYLIEKKDISTIIKLNPTLIGKRQIDFLFNEHGYDDLTYDPDIFDKDITLQMAVDIIRNLQACAEKCGKAFGVKLTNTFPVLATNQELSGKEMYLSGPPLFALSIKTAAVLAEKTGGRVPVSYSGGADAGNIRAVLETGMCPVTVSSVLLKPGGYRNLTLLQKKAEGYAAKKQLDIEALKALAEQAVSDAGYHSKHIRSFDRAEQYSAFCAKCRNCVDVCPNRANIRIESENGPRIIHRDRLCNECGNCAYFCILGHVPYLEKFTVFENEEDFYHSKNDGILYTAAKKIRRYHGTEGNVPEELFQLIRTAYKKGSL